MPNTFLRHFEWWLPNVLRAKAVESARDERLLFIGATDLATMLSDFVLTQLGINPNSCWTACELDHVSDEHLSATSGFSSELLAAAFIGAVIELSPWQGDEGAEFLVAHGVPPDAAFEFVAALDVVTEKLGARGKRLIDRLDAIACRPAAKAAARHHESAHAW